MEEVCVSLGVEEKRITGSRIRNYNNASLKVGYISYVFVVFFAIATFFFLIFLPMISILFFFSFLQLMDVTDKVSSQCCQAMEIH